MGTELQTLLPDVFAPASSVLDITDLESVQASLQRQPPDLIVHAAAYTDVSGAETNRADCWRVNVEGTRNMVKGALAAGLPLLHISTDYVFYGDTGGYQEDDPLGMVRNYYALTKLIAEESVRVLNDHLVVRTSFRPREWAYPAAFSDVYTSQDYVDIIAPQLALAVRHYHEIPFDTLHIASERTSVFELARRRKPDVAKGSRRDVAVDLPEDISLDTSRWQMLKSGLERI